MTKDNTSQNMSPIEITITPPSEGEMLSLNQVIGSASKNCVIRLTDGEYRVDETIKLSESIRLVGAGSDKTFIIGDLPLLVESTSENSIELEGISFITISEKPTTAVKINGGVLKVRACAFSGGVIGGNDRLGMGLCVVGETDVEISHSRFENNQESGLWLDGNTKAIVLKNKFTKNFTGLAIIGEASIEAVDNLFIENDVAVGCSHNAKGIIRNNIFDENRVGAIVKGNSTVSFINNKFNNNLIGIGFTENCDVIVEENEISKGQYGLKLWQDAKVIIRNNKIHNNDIGVYCTDKSSAKILNNEILHHESYGILTDNSSITQIDSNMINENDAAIKFEDMSTFTVENNQIVGNSLFGILVRFRSKGVIHKNIIRKNTNWNVDVREEADVDFDDFKAIVPPGVSVQYSCVDNQFYVSPPDVHQRVFFTELFAKAHAGQVIVLENGEYNLSNPIVIDKPLKFMARTSGEVSITGEDLPALLIYEGEGKLNLSGFKFSLENENQTNGIMIKSGDLEMDLCTMEGAKDRNMTKRDFGAGLILFNNSTATITNSVFKENFLGISTQDESVANLVSNKFIENAYGVVLRDRSNCNASENEYYSNKGFGLMCYDESRLIMLRDICHNNNAGFGFINDSKATVESTESYKNKLHGYFIDNDAECLLKKNLSYSNQMSGIAIYGDSHCEVEENEAYENSQSGVEVNENAKSNVVNNKLHGNATGVYLWNNVAVNVEMNEIFENETGICINDEASGTIVNNKIYKNSGEAIDNSSEKESSIGNNEIFDNGEGAQGDENNEDDDNGGFSLGDLFAKMLGSENLSNDPNTAVIPISSEMSGLGGNDNEDDDGENDSFTVGNIASIPVGISFDNDNGENKREEKVEEREEETVTYYRMTNPNPGLTFLRRNEKIDPYWCNMLDEDGEYHGKSINGDVIQDLIEAGKIVEVTYKEVMDEIKKRKNSN